MNRLVFGLLWFGLVGTVVGVDPQAPARNLVHCGHLDGGLQESGLPVGWSTHPHGYQVVDCYTVTSPVRSGTRSLLLTGREPWVSVSTGRHQLGPATRQFGQAWVQLPKGSTCEAWLRIDYFSENDYVGSSPYSMLKGTDNPKEGWHLLKVEGSVERFPKATTFQMIGAIHGGGTAFWDDFEVDSTVKSGS
jgi:hypothetical protein